MPESVTLTLRRWMGYFRMTEHTGLLVSATIVGIFGAFGSIAFVKMLRALERLVRQDFLDVGLPWYYPLIPMIGGIVAGIMIAKWATEARGHGVPQVIKSVALEDGRMRPMGGIVKTLASVLTIGTGGSAGQEGPMVQIGSTIGSVLGQRLGYSTNRVRILVACGAAAGISATFNAPFAGVLFALEVILGEFNLESFSPVVIASVWSNFVWHQAMGADSVFHIPPYSLVSPVEILFYPVLGIICAIVAVNFGTTLTVMEDWSDRAALPDWLKPGMGGLCLGLLALLFGPEILGNGYEVIDDALEGRIAFGVLIGLIVLKTLATNLTLGSGGSGGIFAPSMVMGASTGGAFGLVVHDAIPTLTGPTGAYALVGMAAVVAAATHAPLTAVLIVFEMTGNYDMILPVMLASIASTLFSRRLSRDSIYLMKLSRQGIHLQSGRDVLVLERLAVRDVMRTDMETVNEVAPLAAIVEKMRTTPFNDFPMLDGAGGYAGMITFDSLRDALPEQELRMLLIASEFADRDYPTTTPDENLHTVLEKLQRQDREQLPVVSAEDPTQLVGIVTRADVIEAYNGEVARRRLEDE